jgi:hypothetical protein
MKVWRARWEAYRQWAEDNAAPDPRSPREIMDDIEFLYRCAPEEVRKTDPDPEKTGVRNLYRAFALYDARLRSGIGSGTGR